MSHICHVGASVPRVHPTIPDHVSRESDHKSPADRHLVLIDTRDVPVLRNGNR